MNCFWTLTYGWMTIYLFPPQSLILLPLNQLDHFRGTAYLVAPLWPARIWFPLLETKSSFPLGASRGCWRRDSCLRCLRFIFFQQKPSRMDFLQRIYSSIHSIAQNITGHFRHSSAHQYESIWSVWLELIAGLIQRPSQLRRCWLPSFSCLRPKDFR